MNPLFHRRSLTLAVLTLLLSLFAVSHGFGYAFRMSPPRPMFALRTIVVYVLACVVCMHATLNLVRDVDRGYSPGRCSLAAVILLPSFLLLFFFGLGLLMFISQNS